MTILKPKIIIQFILFSMCSCHSRMTQEHIENIFYGTGLNPDSFKVTIVSPNVWHDCKWSTVYDDTSFIHYILPPQVADEPIEYYWREDIPERVNIVYQTKDISDLAHKLNSTVEADTRPESWKNGHSFCSVILPDNSLLVFQDRNDDGTTYKFSHKTAKIYRRTFFEDHSSLIYRQQANEPIPSFFLDHRMKDVTSLHKIGSQSELAKSNLERLLILVEKYENREEVPDWINQGHHEYMGRHVDEMEELLRESFPGRDEEFYEYGKWGGGAFNSSAFDTLPIEVQDSIQLYLINLGLLRN